MHQACVLQYESNTIREIPYPKYLFRETKCSCFFLRKNQMHIRLIVYHSMNQKLSDKRCREINKGCVYVSLLDYQGIIYFT